MTEPTPARGRTCPVCERPLEDAKGRPTACALGYCPNLNADEPARGRETLRAHAEAVVDAWHRSSLGVLYRTIAELSAALEATPPAAEGAHPQRVRDALSRLLVKLRWQEGTFSVQEQCDFRAALEYVLAEKPQAEGAPGALRELVKQADAEIVRGQACRSEGEFTRWMRDSQSTREAIAAALAEAAERPAPGGTGWQPIETAPRDREVFFWIVAKSADEAYTTTSGESIVSHDRPCRHLGMHGTWSALQKAVLWHDVPPDPGAPVPAPTPAPPTGDLRNVDAWPEGEDVEAFIAAAKQGTAAPPDLRPQADWWGAALDVAQALSQQLERCSLYGPADGVRDKVQRLILLLTEAHATQPLPACDCGEKLTQCASCAVADWQAAHPECKACCPLQPAALAEAAERPAPGTTKESPTS